MFDAAVIIAGACLGTALALVLCWAAFYVHDVRTARWLNREHRLDKFYETQQPKGESK